MNNYVNMKKYIYFYININVTYLEIKNNYENIKIKNVLF